MCLSLRCDDITTPKQAIPQNVRQIHVTVHAVTQHEERYPGTINKAARKLLIAADVTDALKNGRSSPKEPSFTPRGQTLSRKERQQKRPNDKSLRYVWSEDRNRVYLVDRRGDEIIVVTSLPSNADKRAT